MSNCKDGGGRETQNAARFELRSKLPTTAKMGLSASMYGTNYHTLEHVRENREKEVPFLLHLWT